MRLTIIAALVLATVGPNGCGTTASESIAPPVSTGQLAQMRDEYRRTDPEARVGLVKSVLASDRLALVSEVPVKDFTVGDIISFVDSNGKVVTMGTVEAVNRNSLTVHYANPGPHGRPPTEGDAAVRAIH
jgi:hypothetical protein